VSKNAQDLANRLLEKDPYKRISASEALMHPWFHTTKEKVSAKGMEFMRNLTNYYVNNC
jgi:serine/threonine protein kinase